MSKRLLPAILLMGFLLVVGVGRDPKVATAQGPTGVKPKVASTTSAGTAFTYQGQLKNGTSPFTGTCDFQFTLYDALIGGSSVGNAQAATSLNVVNGLFSTKLDFGPGIFEGGARYLQIAAKCGSDSTFTVLSPRQELTPAPYAVYATNADTLDGQHAGNFWNEAGNSGTSAGSNFLGTTDNVSLTLRANNLVGWRLVPGGTAGTDTANVIGGYAGNKATVGVKGGTIGGGGVALVTCGASNNKPCVNQVTDDYGTVAGGTFNQAGNGNSSTADAIFAVVGGGNSNTASNSFATVDGGQANTASNSYASIGGGYLNSASQYASTIGGGSANTANAQFSLVSGGYQNTASAYGAAVVGGSENAASGGYAVVGGGGANSATADFATVPGGVNASASHYGEMAYSSGHFVTNGDAQTSTYVLRRVTTNSTQTELFLDGSGSRITVPAGHTLTFDILVVGRTSSGTSGGYEIKGVIKNVSGTASFIGWPSVTAWEDDWGWDAAVVADSTNDALEIKVTGANSTTIRWVATVRTAEVQY